MVDPIAVWHAEHKRFSRLLDFLERETAAFHEGDEPDYALMRDVVYYLCYVGDRYHHPREDVAFARLVERDRSLERAIDRLHQEHRVIAKSGDALLRHLENILMDVAVAGHVLETAARTYLVCYRQHLDTEENWIIPRAAQVLTPADWAAVTKAVPGAVRSLVGDNVAARYRSLCEQIGEVA